MIAVHFDKALMEKFLHAFNNAKPIHCEWNGRNMLLLAGALYAAVMSQGPHAHQVTGQKMENLPDEHREATEETFKNDLADAIELIGLTAFQVLDGDYDGNYEPKFSVALYRDAEGQRHLVPHKGVKNV